MTKIILKPHNIGYEVEVWIKDEKSQNKRYFNIKQDAMNEVDRIMAGMVLPPGAFENRCKNAN